MLDASGDSAAAEKAIPAETRIIHAILAVFRVIGSFQYFTRIKSKVLNLLLGRLALDCAPTSSEVCLVDSGCLVRVTMVRMSRPCAAPAPESPIPTSTKTV